MSTVIPSERIETKIYFLRGRNVMLDRDLAFIYGVSVKALNQAVNRNFERFPADFVFKLNREEFENWKSQIVTSNSDRMGLRKMPSAFTEQGIAMLSGVLRSQRAILVHIQIIRTFTRMRELLADNDSLRRKAEAMEKQYDENFKVVFDAMRRLLNDEASSREEIGFKPH